jgi:hypothetical protein
MGALQAVASLCQCMSCSWWLLSVSRRLAVTAALLNSAIPGCLADQTSRADVSALLMQFVRMQQLTTTWLSLPPEGVPAPKEQKD